MFDTLEGEVFKNVTYAGFSHYYVSNMGRVSNGEIIMKQFNHKDGYKRITLSSQGKSKKFAVHRLVAHTFIGEPPSEGMQVNHLNFIRHDNRPENLEWLTNKDNIHYSIDAGNIDLDRLRGQAEKANKASNVARRRKVKLINLETFEEEIYNSVVEASEKTGLDKRAIGAVARGKRNSHKGYTALYI